MSPSSSSSSSAVLCDDRGAMELNLEDGEEQDTLDDIAGNNNTSNNNNNDVADDGDSMSDSSFNGYDALAKLSEEDWDDLHDIEAIARHNEEQWRKGKSFYNRKDWGGYKELLVETSNFYVRFRMSKEHFDYLVDNIRACITVDYMKSLNSTQGNIPLSAEVVAGIGLQALGQGHNKAALADIFGFSDSTVVHAQKMFVDAIDFNDTCRELKVSLPNPNNLDELHELATKWQEVSTAFGLLNGFLGAIDGWLPRTKRPSGVDNPADYFSGHYQCYGLNVQAICDPDLLFLFFEIAAPGKVNNVRAFSRCADLLQWLENLPHEYFLGGDNAYPLSRRVLIPFSGGEVHNETNRTYNFYLSQLRIRIEMAFGLLTQKWAVLADTMKFSNKINGQIISVCMKLHNFCIRMKRKDEEDDSKGSRAKPRMRVGTCNLADLGVDPDNIDADGNIVNIPSDHFSTVIEVEDIEEDLRVHESVVSTFSTLNSDTTRRQAIVENLASRGLERPAANKIRNKQQANE